jgi:hypothetical protein
MGVGVEVISQLQFTSCCFHDLSEKNEKKSRMKTDLHAYDVYDATNRRKTGFLKKWTPHTTTSKSIVQGHAIESKIY